MDKNDLILDKWKKTEASFIRFAAGPNGGNLMDVVAFIREVLPFSLKNRLYPSTSLAGLIVALAPTDFFRDPFVCVDLRSEGDFHISLKVGYRKWEPTIVGDATEAPAVYMNAIRRLQSLQK